MSNAMFQIFPYRKHFTWFFDDESRGLKAEPFVLGVTAMITTIAARVGATGSRISILFSANPFPGHQGALRKDDKGFGEFGGAWYMLDAPGEPPGGRGWLCPATLRYFDDYPDTIYFQIAPYPEQ